MALRAAYGGVPGAFAEIAARAYAPDHAAIGYEGFAAAIDAVRLGAADIAVIPVRNASAGPVPGVDELLMTRDLNVIAHHREPVAMCCLGLSGTDIEGVSTARSHPIALKQSSNFLHRHGWKQVPEGNTARAAQLVRDAEDRKVVALASERTAQLYGLEILARDIQNAEDNFTEFAIVARA